jgi:uncharacterized membrane protein YhfC
MSPLAFVGTPDWRSAVLAIAFAAPWLLLLAGRWLRRPWVWAVVLVGAVLFPVSIAWVQVPIQQGINALYLQNVAPERLQRYVLLAAVPVIFIAGLVQEVAKYGGAVGGLFLVHARRVPTAGLALGAAAGAGYGAMEAFWVFSQIFAAGFTWATVQLGGVAALAAFIERFFTVMFHTAVAALAAYGYAIRRPWRYLLLAIVLHTLVDYMVPLLQSGAITTVETEVIVALVSAATMVAALWVRWRARHVTGDAGTA